MIASIQWQSPNLFWATALALIAALAAVMVLYRPQVRPVAQTWGWAWISPSMRLLAVSTLAIALLRPAIITPLRDQGRGMIAIVVDHSKSMTAVDTGRDPGKLVSTASALGLLPASIRTADFAELRQRVSGLMSLAEEVGRANAELKYARLANRAADVAEAHVRVAGDNLAAALKPVVALAPAELRSQIGSIGGENSSQQIAQINDQISTMQAQADVQLYRDNPSVRDVCDGLAARSRIELVAQALASESIANLAKDWPVQVFDNSTSGSALSDFDPKSLKAEETSTHLVADLRQLQQHLLGQRMAGVLVFSDGKESPAQSGAALVWPGVPIIAVNVGTPEPPDLSIERISYPSTAVVGEQVNVHAMIRGHGFNGRDVDISFTAQQQRQTKRIPLSDDSAVADFTFSPQQTGPCEIKVEIAGQSGEATLANNQARQIIRVVSGESSVVLISGAAGQDIEELRSVLHRMLGLKLTDEPIESGNGHVEPKDLLAADVIVLSDVALPMLNAAQWDAINSAVSQRGATVIIRTSDPAIVAAYVQQPLAASLLPWPASDSLAWRSSPREQPEFKLRVGPASDRLKELIQLSDDRDLNTLQWDRLPLVSRILSLPTLKKAGINILMSEHDSGQPVLIEANVVAGRSFFVATDEIWRLSAMTGNSSPEPGRFWKQFIRQAGREQFAASDGVLGLDADHLLAEPGQPLTIRAQIREIFGQVTPQPLNAHLRITRQGTIVQDRELQPKAGHLDRYEVSFNDFEPGNYTVEFSAAQRTVSLPVVVAVNDEDEMRDVAGDEEELHRIVGWRGTVMGLDEIPTLPQRLTQLQNSEPQLAEVRLWDSPYLFLFVVACFGVEWAVRKHVGLT